MAGGRRSGIGLGLEILGGAAVSYWPTVAILVMLLGAALILWGTWDWWKEHWSKVQPWHILLSGIAGTWLFMTLGLGVAAWIIWSRQGLATSAASNVTDLKEEEGPLTWPYNFSIEGNLTARIFSLRFLGANISKTKFVQLKEANIISSIDGTLLPLEIAGVDADGNTQIVPISRVQLIPPGARVELVAKLGPPDPSAPGKILGVDPKSFLEKWRQFSLADSSSQRIIE
jgi:TRAP-type C4-dicarboxylate transport system permease small subunit